MPDNIDSDVQNAENTPALARACARGASPLAAELAETDSHEEVVSTGELEAIATAVENAPAQANETISSIIAQHPCIRRAIVAAAIRALGAKKWWFHAKKKRRIEEPDYGLSFKAAEFLADRVDGRPAQSVMNLNVEANAASAMPQKSTAEMLAASPAARQALRRMLDQAEDGAKAPRIH